MNLCVNLIEEGEKRHGGSLTTLFLIRALAVALPLALVLFVAHLLISLHLGRNQLVLTEERIVDKKPQLATSADVLKQQKLYRQMLAQLAGFGAMRLDWSVQLDLLRQTVPLEVQLASLHLTRETRLTNTVPKAVHALSLSGKTGGTQPEGNLTRFRLNLLRSPALTNTLSSVEVPEGAFVEDTSPGAHPMDRLFQLNCFYLPREFK